MEEYMKKFLIVSLMFIMLLVGCSSSNNNGSVADKKARNGDYVNIDFVGKVNGVAFEGGTASGYELKLGSNTFIDGFEEQIIGMSINDKKTITVTFPENYTEELAGKEATFDITLHKIYREIQ